MTDAHFAAVKALMPAGVNVFMGSATEKPALADYPYVVIGGPPGTMTGEGMSRRSDRLDLRVKLTYAALTWDQLWVIMRKVRDVVIDVRLVVPGWACTPFEHASLVDIQPDFDLTVPNTSTHPLFAVDELTALSTR